MIRYIISRLLASVTILWGITLAVFLLADSMSGAYVYALIPPTSAPGITLGHVPARLREYYGLDKSLPEQYLIWLRELVLRGNLGYSYNTREPVLKEILHRLPGTLRLTGSAMSFSLFTGVLLGVISAVKKYSLVDHLLTLLGLVWISTPEFVLALLSLYLFSLRIPLFPSGGQYPLAQPIGPLTRLHHMVLPVTVLGLSGVARYMRFTRSSLLEVLNQDYIAVARAKGLDERVVLWRHAWRSALLPLITLVGLDLPKLIGSAFVIEQIFVWRGMASYAIGSIARADRPTIVAVNFVTSCLVLLSNLLTDIAYTWADPRIRLTTER